ncbi:MAG: chemotaxis response regulator protein-glutamate methylesterase [Desulfarculus sp.]|nr:chemotaxis response regulator protein-glutamate methylesterase [Desulfarculus sp.]
MAQIIKVLVVDDSALIREFLRSTLATQPDMRVATAADPYLARDKILRERPDVITLDIEMPRMDGLTFLHKLMAAYPTPVVMFSSRTQSGAEATMKALALGAVDFVAKPALNLREKLPALASEIVEKVRAAAGAQVRRHQVSPEALRVPDKIEVDQVVALTKSPPRPGGPQVVLMGASTGGTVALEQVLCRLPADSPPIAVVQHMPEHFTLAFANRLNDRAQINIAEAKDGLLLSPGHCLIAAGGRHLLLERGAGGYVARVKDGPPVNRHKPSVDVLFRSAVGAAGPNAVAVIMTGMGDDGAKGMKDLHDAGALTIAQNEETCTVYGMPKMAVQMGAADRVVPLERIAPLLMGLWAESRGRSA